MSASPKKPQKLGHCFHHHREIISVVWPSEQKQNLIEFRGAFIFIENLGKRLAFFSISHCYRVIFKERLSLRTDFSLQNRPNLAIWSWNRIVWEVDLKFDEHAVKIGHLDKQIYIMEKKNGKPIFFKSNSTDNTPATE